MSALPPESGHVHCTSLRLLWAKSGLMECSKKRSLFDHLVSSSEHRVRHGETERFGRLEIDRQIVLGWRLHRQVGRLVALENTIDVNRSAPVLVDRIRPIRDQAAGTDEVALGVDRGQLVLCRKGY